MPWPVYLAFKHLFPTGRLGAKASAGATLRLALLLATGIFLLVVGFLWWHGNLAYWWAHRDSTAEFYKSLAILWCWLAVVLLIIAMIFRSTPFFHAMSIFGITLGVTVLLTVQSVMNGFAKRYEEVFIQTQGHLTVSPVNGPLTNPKEVVAVLKQVPGVTLAEPVMGGIVLLRFQDIGGTPGVRSFDLADPDITHDPLATALEFPAKLDDLDDQSVFVGSGFAKAYHIYVGDKVSIYTLRMLDDVKHNEFPLPRELKVAGFINTGWVAVDNDTIFLSLRLMRELYDFNDEAHQIEIRLDRDDLGYTLDKQAEVQKALEPLNLKRHATAGPDAELMVQNWQEVNRDQMQILYVEKTVMFYIMIVIVVVAAFCILCSLATTVVRKTREIGVLGALGARPAQLAEVFCLQGMFIGLVGSALGIGLAVLLLHYRQGIITTFVDQRLIEEFYKFPIFPVAYREADFVKIIGFTFAISTLAGVLPALWAACLKPADCLRSD